MEKVVEWLKKVSGNILEYSDELYREGVALAEEVIKNKALLQSFKPKVVAPIRKKLLFNSLMRTAQLTERMLEKKSEPTLSPETEEEKAARLEAEAKAKAAAEEAKKRAAAEKKAAAAKKKTSQKPLPKADSQG